MTLPKIGISSVWKGNEDRLQALLMNFKQTISEGIEKTEHFVSECLAEETISGEKAEGIALYLQQASIALGKEDFDGFYEAYTGALGLLKISSDQLTGDLKKIHELANMLQKAFTTRMNDETNKITAMARAM